jgi:tetratricopeptide (TPR) repeat protein
MCAHKSKLNYKVRFRYRKIARIVLVAVVFLSILGGILFFSGKKKDSAFETRDLVQHWKAGSYGQVFQLSEHELENKPMDFFLLMTHGFSAYQIALAQINNADTLSYIDRAIWALRKAQLTKQGASDPRVKYVLGRAYFYKGPSYANLCIQYLEEARAARCTGKDIPEFLGLAYAQVQDYRSSVEAFSLALENDESGVGASDLLLLAIARSYIELREGETARPYIIRAIEISRDFVTVSNARLMLAGILIESGAFTEAETQIMAVLNEGGDTAEARFELGELYNAQHDNYRARAEWRKASRLDPNFAPARERLST